MIRRWLLKHRWVNELLKVLVGFAFGYLSYVVWQAGKLASSEIPCTESYKLMVFGLASGMMAMVALIHIIDVLYSIPRILKRKDSGNA